MGHTHGLSESEVDMKIDSRSPGSWPLVEVRHPASSRALVGVGEVFGVATDPCLLMLAEAVLSIKPNPVRWREAVRKLAPFKALFELITGGCCCQGVW